MQRYIVIVVLLVIGIFGLANNAAAQNTGGVIDFSDQAPPPTETDKSAAKRTAERANLLASQIQTLASTLKASIVLREAIAPFLSGNQTPTAQGIAFSSGISDWMNLLPKAVIKDESNGNPIWSVDPVALQSLVGKTVALAAKVKQEQSDNVGTINPALAAQIERLSIIFDAMVAEHGILNARLRYYPFSALEQQSPISCETINSYSRDFKCMPKAEVATPNISTWKLAPAYSTSDYCNASAIQNFSVNDWPNYVTLMRRSSLTDHMLPGRLKDTLAPSAHSASSAGGSCK